MANINFIHPPDFKSITQNKKIEPLPLPKKVVMALSQHTGVPSEPVVNIGDTVKAGSLIAQAKGFISCNLHSSISGKVIAIEDSPHPIIGVSRAIIIESDGQDIKSYMDSGQVREISSLTNQDIIGLIREAGIVGLGGAAFPTSVKMSPPPGKRIDTLIINGAECEPFLTCDHRLMLEKPREIISGIQIVAKVLGVKDVIIGIEDNKIDAIEVMNSMLFRVETMPRLRSGQGNQKPCLGFARDRETRLKVVKLKAQYPQGGEKQLIKVILNREVPSGGLPLDIGVVVNNVQTVFSIYEAVYFKKPLYERIITVSGNLPDIARNILVRIGTPIKDVLEYCGVTPRLDIYKVVMGGPMTGVAQCNLDSPVIKGTSGVLVFDKRFKLEDDELDCIRCARCIDACPVSIMPCMIGLAIKKNRLDIASGYDPFDCIECGSCGYVCPSKIPLVQLIKLAKTKIKR